MPSLFRSRDSEPAPTVEPVATVFPTISGAEIAAVFLGNRVAGDFYDSVRVSPERVLIGLLDVAGLRQDNRPILTAAQDIFRNSGSELFSPPDLNESDAMTDLALRLNRGLIEISSGVHSCPAFIACYHEILGTLCYTNAGHTPALIRDTRGIAELDSTGLPLGLFSHATSEARIVGLEKGASLLLVSRGVVECEGPSDGSFSEFGLDRVKKLFQQAQSRDPKALCSSVLNSASEYAGNAPVCNDRTALALIRRLIPSANSPALASVK